MAGGHSAQWPRAAGLSPVTVITAARSRPSLRSASRSGSSRSHSGSEPPQARQIAGNQPLSRTRSQNSGRSSSQRAPHVGQRTRARPVIAGCSPRSTTRSSSQTRHQPARAAQSSSTRRAAVVGAVARDERDQQLAVVETGQVGEHAIVTAPAAQRRAAGAAVDQAGVPGIEGDAPAGHGGASEGSISHVGRRVAAPARLLTAELADWAVRYARSHATPEPDPRRRGATMTATNTAPGPRSPTSSPRRSPSPSPTAWARCACSR